MATEDRSRSAFYPGKHYAGVRMQQGRVLTDDDYNEGSQIQHEDMRATRVDVIGPHGSPDGGFLIDDAWIYDEDGEDKVNLNIRSGTYYVGGLRAILETVDAGATEPGNTTPPGQRFSEQTDWLQNPGVVVPATDNGGRYDFVYLEVWQQPVSAVEDGELFEAALGGPDTAVRMRTMARVKVNANAASTCAGAAAEMVNKWIEDGLGTWDDRNHELRSAAKLTVSFDGVNGDEDLCSPQRTGGFLGAENQAIRVQLVNDGDAFTWGFDNGAPLYRVELVASNDGLTQLRMLTAPKDQHHWPVAGQVVELLPWGAVLPNGEKLAEELEPPGLLAKVSGDYDPDTQLFNIDADGIPPAFDQWSNRSDEDSLRYYHFGTRENETETETRIFYYLRVWDRGSDFESAAAVSLNDQPVALGHTGLRIQITGEPRRAEDYWIIAARPETPDEVVPWELESDEGRPPEGIRRFYAPLALIHWQNGQAEEITDCRKTFRPLTDLKTCCSFTVGDGILSHGEFNSIEDAVRHLPVWGGEICVLPGIHEANVAINWGFNVRIKGCGLQSIVLPRDFGEPIFQFTNSAGIKVENCTLVNMGEQASGGTQIDGGTGIKAEHCTYLSIRNNRFLAYEHAIRVDPSTELEIQGNLIRMWDREGGGIAIFARGQIVSIERNDVSMFRWRQLAAQPTADNTLTDDSECDEECIDPEGEVYTDENFGTVVASAFQESESATAGMLFSGGLGGIQIGSGSDRIRITENRIRGGRGNGITLGSDLDLDAVSEEPSSGGRPFSFRYTQIFPPNGKVNVLGAHPEAEGVVLIFQSKGKLDVITIVGQDGSIRPAIGSGHWEVSAVGYQVGGSYDDSRSIGLDLKLVSLPAERESVLAPIHDLLVQGNAIARMGLSGIGGPWRSLDPFLALDKDIRKRYWLLDVMATTFGLIGGVLDNTTIQENRIVECLQRASPWAAVRGDGGISLGVCENLCIRRNQIERNGRDHRDPVCGVFVAIVAQIDVTENHIVNNGPLTKTDPIVGVQGGIRGAIMVRVATSVLLSVSLSQILSEEGGGDVASDNSEVSDFVGAAIAAIEPLGTHAARIHGNVVRQPFGRALSIELALGPVSVAHNQFAADFSYANLPSTAPFAGSVLINNLGNPPHRYTFSEGNIKGATSNPLLPNGNVQFIGNETRLGVSLGTAASQVIATLDDLVFESNQSDVLFEQPELNVNTLLLATTLRANNNRFREPI